MQASELLQRIKSNNAPVIIDPRSEMEFKRGHIPGAINAPVRKILLNRARLPTGAEMVIACMHGQRAMMAKWLLALYGYRNTALLEGYLEGWQKAGLPFEKGIRSKDDGNHTTKRDKPGAGVRYRPDDEGGIGR